MIMSTRHVHDHKFPKPKTYKDYLIDYCRQNNIPLRRYNFVIGRKKMNENDIDEFNDESILEE